MNPVQPITIKERQDRATLRLEQMIARQTQERGLTPLRLEPETLLRRVRALDWSGEFLGEALISAYWKDENFNHSLYLLNNLDAEGFRLFHQILHIRQISGWNDDALWDLAIKIKELLATESGHVSSGQE
ncbi:hypothetical protein ABXJ76_07950 [Methylobacter sp. G7]|uniref:hypothetical protein n=1 Tax=Methylobacter sp. G7 TaxID=3230117 RepID=UPI003D80922B